MTSFLGAPLAESPAGAAVAVLGCPFDHGTAQRIGARQGPAAIREASRELSSFDPETGLDLIAALGLVDLGDAAVTPSKVEASFAAIEAASSTILEAGALPVTLGGDGMVSLPQLRAAARRYPDLVTVHLDAHSDCYPYREDNTATTFTRAAEERLVETERSFHIGLRGTTGHPEAWSHPRALGYHLLPMAEVRRKGLAAVVEEVARVVEQRPVYLCFDMDVLDASVTPGVCNPVYGGFSATEALDLVQALAALNVVTFDVNTISPPQDVANMSALMAATVIVTYLQARLNEHRSVKS
ncbi:MAG: arginase family protein [Pseudomonadota bacterium]